MSTASSEVHPKKGVIKPKGIIEIVPWNPWFGIIAALVIFYIAQILSGLIISIYPGLKHWNASVADAWLNNSVTAQFIYILLAETFTVGAVFLFLRRYKLSLRSIGLRKIKWTDPLFGLAALPVYFVIYLVAVAVISHFVPALNVNQQQQIGFNSVHGTSAMIMTFISLVVLPPIAEEILVRGFIYSSLKKAMKIIPAALCTSLLFAAAHLPEGGAAGPLYIAAIDTFVLSLVLIFLREKTHSLWASITLHALKNGVAFVALFVATTR